MINTIRVPIAGLMMIVGLIVGILGVVMLLEARKSSNWIGVSGEVLSSSLAAVRSANKQKYRSEITYKYQFKDLVYEGDSLAFVSVLREKEAAESHISRYKVGTELTVYVDPSEPGRSVIERGVSVVVIIAPISGWTLFALGAMMLFFESRNPKSKTARSS